MPDKSRRQIALLEKLPRLPNKIGTASIQVALERDGITVGIRTVQRDLEELSGWLPIVKDGNTPPGWSWTELGRAMQLPLMSGVEALSLVQLEAYLAPLLPAPVFKSLRHQFTFAKSTLRKHNNSGWSRWPNKVRVVHSIPEQRPPAVPTLIYSCVTEALLEERNLNIEYLPISARNPKMHEGITPLGLFTHQGRMYLIGLHPGTLEKEPLILQYALHRMKSANTGDRSDSAIVKRFNIDTYLKNEGPGFGYGDKFVLKLSLSAEVGRILAESPLSDDQKITEGTDGMLTLSATVPDSYELKWWLMSYGTGVKVLAPDHFRTELIEALTETLEMYK